VRRLQEDAAGELDSRARAAPRRSRGARSNPGARRRARAARYTQGDRGRRADHGRRARRGEADLVEMKPAENGAFAVALPVFEGPLDLLLSLIQEHKLDIFDIPISFVIDRYLEFMEAAKALNIDLAGEYLLMAATLAHIKSRMLLPREQSQDVAD